MYTLKCYIGNYGDHMTSTYLQSTLCGREEGLAKEFSLYAHKIVNDPLLKVTSWN